MSTKRDYYQVRFEGIELLRKFYKNKCPKVKDQESLKSI